jgi:DNA-directed RNA polymerase specialized sigma24 family protein
MAGTAGRSLRHIASAPHRTPEPSPDAVLSRLIQELPCPARVSWKACGDRPTVHRSDDVSDSHFEPLSENELQRLGSDELIAHIREATDAGRPDEARAALAILCWRHFDDVVRRVRLRVPAEDVEDVAMTAILAAIKSAFDGVAVGQFVNWLHRIVDRRGVADYHRRREGMPAVNPLPTEHAGEEDVWGEEPAEADESGAVVVQSLIEECLEALAQPAHRDVIELNVFNDLSAADAAERANADNPDLEPPMSEANVHKIVSRFRDCLRRKLADDDRT